MSDQPAAPLPTAPEPTPELTALLDTLIAAARVAEAWRIGVVDQAAAQSYEAKQLAAARTAIEAKFSALTLDRDENKAAFEAMVAKWDALVEQHAASLSQVEGERDDVKRIALLRSQIITELEARVAALTGALSFYAEGKHIEQFEYETSMSHYSRRETCDRAVDDGEVARAALGSHDGGARHG